MESIPNFDKIVNSSQNIIPKRLSFDFLNNTASVDNSKSHKKRKYNEMDDQNDKRDEMNESFNTSASSLCASWETKLLRSDLIEAQSRVSVFNNDIHNLNLFLVLDHATKNGDQPSEYNSNRART
jgi:hypothetical protein